MQYDEVYQKCKVSSNGLLYPVTEEYIEEQITLVAEKLVEDAALTGARLTVDQVKSLQSMPLEK